MILDAANLLIILVAFTSKDNNVTWFCMHNGIDLEDKDFARITKVQEEFIAKAYTDRHLEKLIPAAKDLIAMNNALSLVTAEGKESLVELSYHPDDLMSEYGTDIVFFAQNAGRHRNKTKVFATRNGPDWQVQKYQVKCRVIK